MFLEFDFEVKVLPRCGFYIFLCIKKPSSFHVTYYFSNNLFNSNFYNFSKGNKNTLSLKPEATHETAVNMFRGCLVRKNYVVRDYLHTFHSSYYFLVKYFLVRKSLWFRNFISPKSGYRWFMRNPWDAKNMWDATCVYGLFCVVHAILWNWFLVSCISNCLVVQVVVMYARLA